MNRHTSSIRQFFIFLLLAPLLAACGMQVESNVSSLAQPFEKEKTYVLLPAAKSVRPDDLQFREYASYIERVLASAGYEQVPGNEANIAIFLGYGIGEPKEHIYSYSLPVWGQTGIASSTTYGTLNSYGSMANYSGTTTYTPSYGITGYTSHIGTDVTFTRYLLLDAYDVTKFHKTKKMSNIWVTKVLSTGSSGDLRLVLPVMAAAAQPYIGTNTGQFITVTLGFESPEVKKVKGITP